MRSVVRPFTPNTHAYCCTKTRKHGMFCLISHGFNKS